MYNAYSESASIQRYPFDISWDVLCPRYKRQCSAPKLKWLVCVRWLCECDHSIILSHFLKHALAWRWITLCSDFFSRFYEISKSNRPAFCIALEYLSLTMRKKYLRNYAVIVFINSNRRQFCCCAVLICCLLLKVKEISRMIPYSHNAQHTRHEKKIVRFFFSLTAVTFLCGGFTNVVTVNQFFFS